ncbi:hypothetical protein SSYIS1_40760 (plasmid) [Serratia symbiotica]|uniref:Uncharacterized protein n=1 Tax=Serratia symbiotica TaxID=138074 RepID=A0A455VJ62_9GAMM|nr:hypothetical protein SSYIS1_40760 [Serratia symbiotica]
MKSFILFSLISVLAGCASSYQKPAGVSGELIPINSPEVINHV